MKWCSVSERFSQLRSSIAGKHIPPSAQAGEVPGEFEDKLAGEEEMASSDPVLPAQNSSSLATFSFVEPTRAATDSDDEQVNNVNQI